MSDTILDAIGNTPLVAIRRLNPNPRVRLLAKLEYMNPGGSIKDRAALAMIEAGEASGDLSPDKTVIEATSGNTGIGLALVCAVKGYRLLLAMSERVSIERQKILKARGAQLLLTPGHLGTDGAIEEVYRLALENPDAYFMVDQFNNEANWQAHYNGTAFELWEQTGHQIDAVVATMGTTGTLMGLSRRLKALDPNIRIIGVEPYLGHGIQGLKNMKEAYRPEIYQKALMDEKINIEDEVAFDMTRRLAMEEGLFVGMSSGAAMAVARQVADRMEAGTLVVVLPDGGERYLSTPVFHVQDQAGPVLFNTLTRRKTHFEPLTAGEATVYSCGPTAYAPIHLGYCRRFIFADLLCRYLSFRGYAVRHIMNITDIDDRTIDGSEAAGLSLADFTAQHIQTFIEDIEHLGIEPAESYPRASEHIDDMVALAAKLIEKGVAYEKLRSIYFDISRLPEYGRLSGIDLDKIRLGATVDLDDYEKDNPRDFTLLRRSTLSELKRGIYTPTQWGNIRPSWHIQCAAISMKLLGDTFDIHTSGRELVFPHHENENAIAFALTGKPLANYWVHCDTVVVNGKSIDHSADGPTLKALMEKGYTGREIRYWLLSTHYRKPVRYSVDQLALARKALRRLDSTVQSLFCVAVDTPAYRDIDQLVYDIKNGFKTAMDDDLNISAALASIFKTIKRINGLVHDRRIDVTGAQQLLAALGQVNNVLNIFDFHDPFADPGVQHLIQERDAARAVQDWERADRIRDQLSDMGITLKDPKTAALD